MKSEIKKIIEREVKKYSVKEIKISNKKYPLYVIPELCDEDLNIFEGILLVEAGNKDEVSYFKSRYKPPVSGYTPRIGIIFYNEHLLIKDYRRNRHIIKTLRKINKAFIDKLRKALSQSKEETFAKLFDRTDIIEEFYILYKKAREYLLKNIKGISEEARREELVDNFMMQMLTLWYLQERGFFNNDKNYFITKFKEFGKKKLFNGFKNYYEFLTYLFEKISGQENKQYYEDRITGKVVIIGPAVFLNGEHNKAISIPDKCFYEEGMTDILIKTPPKKVTCEVPLLNLFESRDWTEGNIDEFVLGAIYEKLITYMERKKLGAYYTPEEITSYICKNTIEPYLVNRVNEEFKKSFETIEQIIENEDEKIILYLFEQLKEIKILDPAVGSAHFLESAINVLVNIYENILNKAKEIGIRKGLEIISADEKGEIKRINLLEINDEDKFKLLVKFFIVISKNIYGVDINPSALKVAKARLFLSLAKHFKAGKEKDIFIRFPNVHFNLRDGNSLIGYIEVGKEKETQLQLDFSVKEKQADYISEKIKIVSTLKPYLEKTASTLKINGDILREIEELNKILSKNKIEGDDFKKVLQTKEKLIKILIASLNSQYAVPLNELLREITDLFNQKLDEKFAEEYKIDLGELKKIKTFHWIFEFPEVFLRENSGFDVVVGNPPYGNTLENLEKRICKNYASYTGEIASVFVERSIPLNERNGYFSFIITYAITFSKDLSGTRRTIFENYDECYISTFDRDKCRFFDNMTQSVSIMLCKNKAEGKKCKFYTSKIHRTMPEIDKIKFQYANDYLLGNKAGVSFYEKHRLPKIGEKTTLEILKKITQNNKRVANLVSTSREKIWIRTSGNYWYNAWERKPYDSSEIKSIKIKSDYKDFLIILINSSTFYIWFRIYGDGRHMNTDIMKALPVPPKEKIKNGKNLIFLTSKLLMDFLFYNFDEEHNRFITSNVKPVIDLCDIIIGKLYGFSKEEIDFVLSYEKVIRGGKRISPIFFTLIDYALLLQNSIQKYFLSLINPLIYELYFKEKFYQDGLYPEPQEYLLQAISKHLKPISYDRWALAYWKKQLEGSLTQKEEKELEKLEKENLKIVEAVYKNLKEDKEVQELIKTIKSHKWVEVIEEEYV